MAQNPRESVFECPDGAMTLVPKDFFFEGLLLPVDIYFRLSENRFLVIGRKGEKATFKELQGFSKPGFKIFVRNDDHFDLINFITSFTEKVIVKEQIPKEVKAKFLTGLISDASTFFEKSGFTNPTQILRLSEFIVEFGAEVESFDEIFRILKDMKDLEAKLAMSTAMVALLIAEEMGITQKATFEKLTLASMLHDVGVRHVPPEVLNKPSHLWNYEERFIYEQHPLKAVEILKNIKALPDDVLLMIAEHHENALGTGFPKRLRDVKVSPLGRILGLANQFSHLIIHSEVEKIQETAQVTLQYIENVLGQPFNKQVYSSLKNIVNKEFLSKKQKKVG